MDHLHHLRRDRGCGPWGTYTSPGSPANAALSRTTPGPVGVQDETQAFIAAAARSVADPLEAAVDAARGLAEARERFAGKLGGLLENFLASDFAMSLPSLNTLEAMARCGAFPGWFPDDAWEELITATKKWEASLGGIDAGESGKGDRKAGFAGDVARAYAVGGRARELGADFSGIDRTLPPPAFVEACRKEALEAGGGGLVTAARAYREFRSAASAGKLCDALAYFNALSPEWPPSKDDRYAAVEGWIEILEKDAPDLFVSRNAAGVLILPRYAR